MEPAQCGASAKPQRICSGACSFWVEEENARDQNRHQDEYQPAKLRLFPPHAHASPSSAAPELPQAKPQSKAIHPSKIPFAIAIHVAAASESRWQGTGASQPTSAVRPVSLTASRDEQWARAHQATVSRLPAFALVFPLKSFLGTAKPPLPAARGES